VVIGRLQTSRAELDATTIRLVLDGEELETQRTAIKQFVEVPEDLGGAEEAYYFQQGAIKAPGDLSVGTHTFAFTATFPGQQNDRALGHHQTVRPGPAQGPPLDLVVPVGKVGQAGVRLPGRRPSHRA
jgi:hypothetical protein